MLNKNFIKLLKPQNIFLKKKRIGPNEDGGYVMPEYVLENCSALFTYGVGGDSRYELEFAKTYKKPTYLFDHIIFAPIPGYEEHQKKQQESMTQYWAENECTFIPNGLGYQENCKDFYENYKELNITGHVFLKIDIEGGEYDYFLKTSIENLRNSVMGISLEVHWIDDPILNIKLCEILERIEEHFILCHVHGNNWGNLFEFEGYNIPQTLELSFINKIFVDKFEPDNQKYPIDGLDVPNNPKKEDYNLDFLNHQINNTNINQIEEKMENQQSNSELSPEIRDDIKNEIKKISDQFHLSDPKITIQEGAKKIFVTWEIDPPKDPVSEIETDDLDYYIEKYGTDKKLSGYSNYYKRVFENIRTKKMNVLEIGIGTLLPGIPSTFIGNLGHYPQYTPGGSLRAWREYFKNSHIYGIDIADDCLFEEERIKTFIFDSQDKEKCDDNLTNLSFDVIIDDGLHTAIGQIKTMQNLFDRVKINGYYIIEDCRGSGDGTHIFNEYNSEFREIADEHEYVNLGNIIFIRKNNSGKGNLSSLDNFLQNNPKLRVTGSIPKINIIPEKPKIEIKNKELTVVTGLWEIGRQGREFDHHYLEHLKLFLQIPVNMFIYIPKEYEDLIWSIRSKENTYVRITDLDYIKNLYSPFWDKTQAIRKDPKWHNMTGEQGWLSGSPQATLEYYNPIVQSKMFLLNDVTIWDPFDTEYFIWLDAGITNTVHDKLFTESRSLDKIIPYLDDFLFLSYPYDAVNEIHGFDFAAINRFAGQTVKYVCRGGLFGGKKEMIHQANSTYYSTLMTTLDQGYMGTEESIFTIMAYREPNLYRRYSLDGDGLISKFIEALISNNIILVDKPTNSKPIFVSNYELSKLKTNLYILTFNFPEQVQHTINTMEKVPEWLTNPHLVLIDNSTNSNAIEGNKLIAQKYNMEYIPMEKNTGICGGRQKAAEHFNVSDADFMFFFEDDMTVNPPEMEGQFCRNGFRKYIPNLYTLVHKIMLKERYDFLKLSFTEVFFDNDKSLPWYNVPQIVRTRDWPDYSQLPLQGLDPNSPPANYKHVKICDGLAYIEGDVNYANWPMIVSKEGNKKMFIDTTWAHPYEQTWSSHVYNLMKDGIVTAGLLLASPIWHDRILWYEPEERREN